MDLSVRYPSRTHSIYNSSTSFLARSVFLRNTRLDLILGFARKQLMRISCQSFSRQRYSTRSVTIVSSFTQWRSGWDIGKNILVKNYLVLLQKSSTKRIKSSSSKNGRSLILFNAPIGIFGIK